jgi:hypothetical protein
MHNFVYEKSSYAEPDPENEVNSLICFEQGESFLHQKQRTASNSRKFFGHNANRTIFT